MVIFPVVAAAVSGVFSLLLFQQYASRKGLPQLFWGISLAMFAVASVFVAFGAAGSWDKTLFKGYWLFGALLNVPFLALGSVALLRKPVLTSVGALLVAVATLYAVGVVAVAKANEAAFVAHPYDVPLGKNVWGKSELVARLGSYYSIPAYFVVVIIAVLSSRKRGEANPPPRRVRGNWTIVAGVTLVSVAGALARYKRGAFFSIFLAIGVIVMFVGFMLASRAPTEIGPPGVEAEP